MLRMGAATDARRDEGDQTIVIVARMDARQAVNLAEAFWRTRLPVSLPSKEGLSFVMAPIFTRALFFAFR